jgi:hypothetical protein
VHRGRRPSPGSGVTPVSVPEFARLAERIVEDLDPPDPKDAHSRRYLYLSKLADGSVRGRFACGPAQALTLTAVLAALAGPQPGKAVDADGVERDLPDERSAPQRRMDALVDAIDHNHPECHCRHAVESTRNAEPAQEAACSTAARIRASRIPHSSPRTSFRSPNRR